MFVDMNISMTAAIHSIIIIINENTVCLNISTFMLSFLLSFTIDLYSLNPLTASAITAGIINKFCRNIVLNMNAIPFCIPIIFMHIEIVYHRENPL